jgi:hypothetical protein
MFLNLSSNRKNAFQAFFIVLLYGISFYVLQLFLWNILMLPDFPDYNKLTQGDAGWYKNIVDNGYVHNANSASNTGFFILFPWIWKLSCLGTWGISILNLIFFATGFAILVFLYPIPIQTQLIWLSTPSLFFMFIPYSEAIFFLLVSLCFYGIVYKKNLLIFIVLFLISLTRSVSIILIPTFLLMKLLTRNHDKWGRVIIEYLFVYLFPIILGLLFFCLYQYHKTGIWLDYFYQQGTYWGHFFAIPILPFWNPWGWRILWINALALFISFIAGVYLLSMLYKFVLKKYIPDDKVFIISLCYLVLIGLINVFYSPTWGSLTTNVMANHRYIFATPFFFIFLNYFTSQFKYKNYHFILILILSNAFWLMFGSYTHIQHLLLFNANTIIIFLYMLYAKKLTWPILCIMAINVILQISLFQQYIAGRLPE